MRVFIALLAFVALSFACDIILHVKSNTESKFEAQVTASNGKKSDKWKFPKKLTKFTFQQKADECGLGDWQIETFQDGKSKSVVKVTLDGIGRVSYLVGDDLKPVQKDRQGAICKGECAPL